MSFIPSVSPNERLRLVSATAALMCVASAGIVARTMGTTIFLTQFDASLLSYMYIATAAIVTLSAFLCGMAIGRASLTRVIVIASAVLAITLVLLRVWLLGSSDAASVAIYVFSDVVSKVPSLLFWSFAGSMFNPREAKRLFGVLGAGGTLACVIAGAFVKPFASRFGTENLALLVAAQLAGFAAVVLLYNRRDRGRHEVTTASAKRRAPVSLGYYLSLLKIDHVRNLGRLVALATIALVLTDFMFKSAARAVYTGPALAGFLGTFYAASSLVALVFQLFAVHLILQRGGLLLGLLVLPAGLLVTSLGVAATGSFSWIVAAKFIDPVFDFTVNAAAIQLLYLGVRAQTRAQSRAFVEGIAKPVAVALAGLALAGLARRLDAHALSQIIAACSLVWIVLCWRSYRSYVSSLVESIGARRFDLSNEMNVLSDRLFEDHFREKLRTATDDEINYLLAVLPDLGNADWTREHRLLLSRPSPDIKIAALEYLRQNHAESDLKAVMQCLDHPDPGVRKAAVRASAAIGGAAAAGRLNALLNDVSPEVRAAATAELMNVGDLDGLLSACVNLKQMLVADDPAARSAAAEALASVSHEGRAKPLGLLLADPDLQVREAALHACTQRPVPQLIPSIIEVLREPTLASEAGDALVIFGKSVLPYLEPLLDDDEALACTIPQIAARAAGSDALPFLLRAMKLPNVAVRSAAIAAFVLIVNEQPSTRPYAAAIQDAIHAELDGVRRIASVLADVGEESATRLLRDVFEDDYTQHLRNLLTLAATGRSDVDINSLFYSVTRGAADKKAEALEILDDLVKGPARTELLALFEKGPSEPSAIRALDRGEVLRSALGHASSEWTMAGIAYTAGAIPIVSLAPTVKLLLKDRRPAVRETALHAMSRLVAAPELHQVAESMREDNDASVRNLAVQLTKPNVRVVSPS